MTRTGSPRPPRPGKRSSITFVRSWATITPDGLYRYSLGRIWDEALPVLGWCACNPSKADGDELDPTTWRMVDFSSRWGYGGFELGNVYAFRSTQPAKLWTVRDPVGPANDEHLHGIASRTGGMVVAWGTIPKRDRVYDVTKVLTSALVPLWCLRLTKGKLPQPEHPLYVPAETRRQKWP